MFAKRAVVKRAQESYKKLYGENDPDILDKVNQDALDYCSTQADNCQLMYGIHDIPDNK